MAILVGDKHERHHAILDAAERLLLRSPDRIANMAEVAQEAGLAVLDGPPEELDPTRLVVGVAGTGAGGLDVEDDLDALGFAVEMGQIMEYMPAERQTLLFSATVPLRTRSARVCCRPSKISGGIGSTVLSA